MKELRDYFISPTATLTQALKQLDGTSEKTLFVIDPAESLLGTLSDGDLRRAILTGKEMTAAIDGVYCTRPTHFIENAFTPHDAKDIFLKKRIELVPVVNASNQVIDYITWDEAFGERPLHHSRKEINGVPVVIMAGGKGTRMAPFTNVLPKPLIPVQDKTIMERIIEQFTAFGAVKFYFTLNYKGKMIEAYFESIDREYEIVYLWEKNFQGTAASLTLAAAQIEDTFIVSNCDIIVRADYADVLEFHRHNKAMLTTLSSIQHHQIPYGVVEFSKGGRITRIVEKPEYTHPVNTGVYILDKRTLDYIPRDRLFHMTHLIEALIAAGQPVFTYPVNESDYIDIGQWSEYKQALQKLSLF